MINCFFFNLAGTVEEVLFSHTRQLKQTLKFQQVTRYGTRLIAMVAIATIKNIKLIHKGVYSCKAKNNAGADEKKIKFIVHPKPKLPRKYLFQVRRISALAKSIINIQ